MTMRILVKYLILFTSASQAFLLHLPSSSVHPLQCPSTSSNSRLYFHPIRFLVYEERSRFSRNRNSSSCSCLYGYRDADPIAVRERMRRARLEYEQQQQQQQQVEEVVEDEQDEECQKQEEEEEVLERNRKEQDLNERSKEMELDLKDKEISSEEMNEEGKDDGFVNAKLEAVVKDDGKIEEDVSVSSQTESSFDSNAQVQVESEPNVKSTRSKLEQIIFKPMKSMQQEMNFFEYNEAKFREKAARKKAEAIRQKEEAEERMRQEAAAEEARMEKTQNEKQREAENITIEKENVKTRIHLMRARFQNEAQLRDKKAREREEALRQEQIRLDAIAEKERMKQMELEKQRKAEASRIEKKATRTRQDMMIARFKHESDLRKIAAKKSAQVLCQEMERKTAAAEEERLRLLEIQEKKKKETMDAEKLNELARIEREATLRSIAEEKRAEELLQRKIKQKSEAEYNEKLQQLKLEQKRKAEAVKVQKEAVKTQKNLAVARLEHEAALRKISEEKRAEALRLEEETQSSKKEKQKSLKDAKLAEQGRMKNSIVETQDLTKEEEVVEVKQPMFSLNLTSMFPKASNTADDTITEELTDNSTVNDIESDKTSDDNNGSLFSWIFPGEEGFDGIDDNESSNEDNVDVKNGATANDILPPMFKNMFEKQTRSSKKVDSEIVTTTKPDALEPTSEAGKKTPSRFPFTFTKPSDTLISSTNNAPLSSKEAVGIEVASLVVPHPKKKRWGGEDALFTAGRTFGVFDGVSGAEKESGKALYSKTLAKEYKQRCTKGGKSMNEIISILNEVTELANVRATGASTALVANIDEDNILRVLNVGDCKLIVIRDGIVAARTKDIMHYFDCPYQLCLNSTDKPRDGTKLQFELMKGDIVIAASDGVFDNLNENRIRKIVNEKLWSSSSSSNISNIVKLIVNEAKKTSLDKTIETPYSIAAKKHYKEYKEGIGGKPDDISCIIARCT